jgi:hypothetical protein
MRRMMVSAAMMPTTAPITTLEMEDWPSPVAFLVIVIDCVDDAGVVCVDVSGIMVVDEL